MKCFLLILISVFFSLPSLACISLPRTVALQNSPFFFDQFNISGYDFQVNSALGQQTARFTCKQENGRHQWYLSASDDGATAEPDAIEEFAVPMVNSAGTTFMLNDPDEVPQVTLVGPFVSGADEATLDFRSATSGNYMTLRCENNPSGTSQMVMEMKDAAGNVIATVGAAHNGLTRSVSLQREADATVDMANLSPQSVSIPGCGGVEANTGHRPATPEVER